MTQSAGQPTPNSPGVLDYQRREKRRRRVVGGLNLLAGTVLTISLLISMAVIVELLRAEWTMDNLLSIAIPGGLPIVWGGSYITFALLFQRRRIWAGWLAISMTAAMLGGWLYVGVVMISGVIHYSNPLWSVVATIGVIVAVAVGLAAVIFEVFWALREPAVWVEPQA